MAQTIKIKRSSTNGDANNSYQVPSSLASGELAYLKNNTHEKLYIGNPGGSSGDISVIGGKDFTDKLDLIGAANGSTTADARVVASATKLGVIRIGDGLSIAANGEVSADEVTSTSVTNAGALMDSEVTNLAQVKAFSSADYATAAQGTLATNALPKSGGTLTGNLSFGDNVKAQFGASNDLQIYHDSNNSIIKDAGSGVLRYTSSSSSAAGVVFEIENTDTDAASGSFIHFKDSSGLDPCKIGAVGSSFFVMSPTNEYMIKANSNSDVELYYDNAKKLETTLTGINVVGTVEFDGLTGTGSVTVTDILDQDDMSSNSATALATQQSIKAYGANVTLTADNSTNASHYIPFADSATGNQGLQTDSALVYNPSTNGLSVGTSGNISTGTLSVASSIHGPSTFYIDPAPDDTGEVGGSTTDTGTVVILGDLRVTGETTTVNSTTVSVGDNEIVLNGDHTGTPTLDAGIRVERGSLTDAWLNWDESEDSWVVNEGQSSSPYFYTLLHSNNFETAYTGNIDGGTF